MAKVKFYAVAVGRNPGVYNTWGECQEQTSKYSGAIFKSFKTPHEAQAFVNAHSQGGSSTARKRPRDDDKMVIAVASSTTRTSTLSSTTTKKSSNNDAEIQITIHFDGGSRGNPGLAGSGAEVVVTSDHTTSSTSKITTYLIREFVGNSETNNYAEYKGLLAGLYRAKICIEEYKSMQTNTTIFNNKPLFHLQFYGDSKLVIEQLGGAWRCEHSNLQILYQLCQKLIHKIKQIDANSTVTGEHVYREQNKVADSLANEAMDKKRSWTTTTTESTSADRKCDGSNNDERKQSAVPVSKKRKSGSVWESDKGIDVIDGDNSDSDDSYNC